MNTNKKIQNVWPSVKLQKELSKITKLGYYIEINPGCKIFRLKNGIPESDWIVWSYIPGHSINTDTKEAIDCFYKYIHI